jgi:Cu/Ag efflux pump CusA
MLAEFEQEKKQTNKSLFCVVVVALFLVFMMLFEADYKAFKVFASASLVIRVYSI